MDIWKCDFLADNLCSTNCCHFKGVGSGGEALVSQYDGTAVVETDDFGIVLVMLFVYVPTLCSCAIYGFEIVFSVIWALNQSDYSAVEIDISASGGEQPDFL